MGSRRGNIGYSTEYIARLYNIIPAHLSVNPYIHALACRECIVVYVMFPLLSSSVAASLQHSVSKAMENWQVLREPYYLQTHWFCLMTCMQQA